MYKKVVLVFMSVFILWSYCYSNEEVINNKSGNYAISYGILQGGGALLGADVEILIYKNVGTQLGAGIIGGGGVLTVHLKKTLQSSYFTLSFWNRGLTLNQSNTVDFTNFKSIFGPTFVYRSKKGFTVQVGSGIENNSLINNDILLGYTIPKLTFMFSVGFFHIR